MNRFAAVCIAAAVLFVPAHVEAQSANPMMDAVKAQWAPIKGFLLKTAAKVPDDVWSFKPTPEVRTFAQIMGHVVNAQYLFCSTASGEAAPRWTPRR